MTPGKLLKSLPAGLILNINNVTKTNTYEKETYHPFSRPIVKRDAFCAGQYNLY